MEPSSAVRRVQLCEGRWGDGVSVEAITWAYRQEIVSGPKFVLVTLANSCDDSGVTWRGQASIEKATGFGRRTVGTHMQSLEAERLIGRLPRFRKNGSRTSDYTILGCAGERSPMMPPDPDEVPSALLALLDHAQISPRADFDVDHAQILGGPPEPSGETSGGERRARVARGSVRIGGSAMNAEAWELAQRVLAEFNAQAGRKYRALKSSGAPSLAATYVYKRIREYPDLTFEEHADIVRRTIASRWWKEEGPPSFNVVYGPNVFEENITRPGAPARRNGHAPAVSETVKRGDEILRRAMRGEA